MAQSGLTSWINIRIINIKSSGRASELTYKTATPACKGMHTTTFKRLRGEPPQHRLVNAEHVSGCDPFTFI